MKKLFSILLCTVGTVTCVITTEVFGQGDSKIDSLDYKVSKEKIKRHQKDSVMQSALVFRIPKRKIHSPGGMYFKVITRNDEEVVFSKGVGRKFISGEMVDTLNYFDTSKTDFIFRVDSLPPGNYLIKCKVFQENGEVLIIDKKQKL